MIISVLRWLLVQTTPPRCKLNDFHTHHPWWLSGSTLRASSFDWASYSSVHLSTSLRRSWCTVIYPRPQPHTPSIDDLNPHSSVVILILVIVIQSHLLKHPHPHKDMVSVERETYQRTNLSANKKQRKHNSEKTFQRKCMTTKNKIAPILTLPLTLFRWFIFR